MERVNEFWVALKGFGQGEDGASTVDFVVVTAFGVALTIIALNAIGGTAVEHSERIDQTYDQRGVGSF